MAITENDVLIVVDVQNDFCTGTLAIPDAEAIIPVLNRLGERFARVVATQDWHPPGHVSFASAHGRQPGEIIQAAYGAQKVYRDHCVRESWGAALHAGLVLPTTELIIRKGCRRDVDSFSGFTENDRVTSTGLADYLRARGGTRRIFCAGLALHGCVKFTAIDGAAAGFETFLIEDASRGRPDPVADPQHAAELEKAGVKRITSAELPA